ncbi:MAG: hypothetical protein JO257_15455 [Deltaproteobacteria bacterium]|nr:hypothetical protein [Deltaproteobacteria bacterium]
MVDLIEAIRVAVAPDATPEARVAGATACRAILTALEATPGEPMTAAPVAPPTPVTAIVGALRGVPPDQLLDLAIAKLRSMLPADAKIEPITPLKFIHVPVPQRG